jgi:hypothetical protein
MYKIFAACIALALPGCEARPASDLQAQAFKAYIKCLHRAVRRLDDHRSDASIVAAAVVEKCSDEHDTAATMPKYAPQEITTATTVVLDERNKNPN